MREFCTSGSVGAAGGQPPAATRANDSRKGCGHEQEEKDKTQRLCPKCKMKLWPRAKSRPLRFHELRHTFGSVLIMSCANLVSMQKLLGHSNPKITAETY